MTIVLVFCFLVFCNIGASIEEILVDNQEALKLNRVIVATQESYGYNLMKDVLPNVNAYIFEYKKGFRIPGDELLLGDTKSWKFPRQDVSMGINYPEDLNEGNSTYCITHFRIFISQDSGVSEGYMMSGGPGKPYIELKFVGTETKYLSYDFRLFGIHYDLLKNCSDLFGE